MNIFANRRAALIEEETDRREGKGRRCCLGRRTLMLQ